MYQCIHGALRQTLIGLPKRGDVLRGRRLCVCRPPKKPASRAAASATAVQCQHGRQGIASRGASRTERL